MRSSTGSGNADDVARLKKKNQNRNHFKETVMGSIFPEVPSVPTIPVDAKELSPQDQAEADFLAHLDVDQGQRTFVDHIRDYAEYEAMGWNPEIMQRAEFHRDGSAPSVRFMGPADGPDTGLLFNPAPRINKRVQLNFDRTPVIEKDPIGRWVLNRATRGECQIQRSRKNFFVDLDGDVTQVYKNHVHNPDSECPFVFVDDINKTCVDPGLRLPVIVDMEHWVEDAQIVELDGRFFAHRNLLGTIQYQSLDGKPGISYPIMERDAKVITDNRRNYSNLCKNWREMTPSARTHARQNNERYVPKHAKSEAFLVKAAGVLAGKDNYFVEVQQNEQGKWLPMNRA